MEICKELLYITLNTIANDQTIILQPTIDLRLIIDAEIWFSDPENNKMCD